MKLDYDNIVSLDKCLIDDDIRPVKCLFCQKKMYYIEHPKWEKELQVEFINEEWVITTLSSNKYMHNRCYQEYRLEKRIENKGW